MLKRKLNCYDQSNKVCFYNENETRNDVINRKGAAYDENKTELSWSIR